VRADTLQTTHAFDNVVIPEYDIAAGAQVRVRHGDAEIALHVLDDVPFGCLLAVRDIPRGHPIVRGGVQVGVAAAHIRAGQRVDIR